MSRRRARNSRRDIRPGRRDPTGTILAVLAAQPWSVWFDPAWDPGVTLQDDAGTQRMTALQSRPITGMTQYTISQGSLSLAPATTTTANGKRALTFGGTHSLTGAATLAPLLQLTAAYSEVAVASRSASSTMMRWCAGHSSIDNRISHYHSASGTSDSRQRTSAGSTLQNTPGAVIPVNTPRVFSGFYNGSYSAWLHGVPSLVASANARAPAALDTIVFGAQMSAGSLNSFWSGMQAGLVLIGGAFSTTDRQALESAVGAYYGYPV